MRLFAVLLLALVAMATVSSSFAPVEATKVSFHKRSAETAQVEEAASVDVPKVTLKDRLAELKLAKRGVLHEGDNGDDGIPIGDQDPVSTDSALANVLAPLIVIVVGGIVYAIGVWYVNIRRGMGYTPLPPAARPSRSKGIKRF